MQEDLRNNLRKKVFLGGRPHLSYPLWDFVAFDANGNFGVGQTLTRKTLLIATLDEIWLMVNEAESAHNDSGIDAFLTKIFSRLDSSKEEEGFDLLDSPKDEIKKISQYRQYRKKFLKEMYKLNNGRFWVSGDYWDEVDKFIDFAVKVPEISLLPDNFRILLDRGGNISQVMPWHKPDITEKAAGLFSAEASAIAVAIGCSGLSVDKITNHEAIHAYDWQMGRIALGLSYKQVKADKSNIKPWTRLVEKIKTAAGWRERFIPTSREDNSNMARWMQTAQASLTPEFIKGRIAESNDPYHALLLDMAERINYGFQLTSPLYDDARKEFANGEKWLMNTEHLAYFVQTVRAYSEPEDWLNPNAPILKLTQILAPNLTSFYQDVYLANHLIPDIEAKRQGKKADNYPIAARFAKKKGDVPGVGIVR